LLEIADAQAVIISLDREGAYCRRRGQAGRRIPHQCPREVYDVTGAGDETLAALAVAMAEGMDYEQAEELANVAGGLEVERFGFVPITRQEVVEELRRTLGLRGGKVMDRAALADEIVRRRRAGEIVAFTNGCFDLLHMGHVRYLQQARERGNCLVVAINSDLSVGRLKGPSRPVIGQRERAEMLGALECVDYVTVFDEDTPEPLLKLLKPDLLVKGGSTGEIVGQGIVEGYGGTVLKLDLVEGLSTTDIINRILSNGNGG
jgi:D-beta-D-heptose 7-phosphate kinase/D-beta-D-heptose 1-phosphate adenosyltransferase